MLTDVLSASTTITNPFERAGPLATLAPHLGAVEAIDLHRLWDEALRAAGSAGLAGWH